MTLVELRSSWVCDSAAGHRIFTSLEGENPGGSIKDILVSNELEDRLYRGLLLPGDSVAEISAGSTARSLAYHCRRLKLQCVLFLPDTYPADRLQELTRLGAQLHLISPEGAYEQYEAFCKTNPVQPFNQLTDSHLKRHYRNMALAVSDALSDEIDAVVGAVGTAHSLLGIAETLECPSITAEPKGFTVPGIRNISTRFGPIDPVRPEWFERRILIGPEQRFPGQTIDSNHGPIDISSSFQVVLGAAKVFLQNQQKIRLFLIGADNQRALL